MKDEKIKTDLTTENNKKKFSFAHFNLGNGKSDKKMIIAIIAIIIIIVIAAKFVFGGEKKSDSQSTYTYSTAQKMNIVESLSGSGTLEPADQYTVTTLLSGDIISDTFEEGDIVKKDQVIYEMDSSDMKNTIERAEISSSSAQRNYQNAVESLADLNVKSKVAGNVIDIAVEVGDSVNAGQEVATVRDDSVMTIELPFPADDVDNFYVGESAEVTLYGSFESLNGTVTQISGATNVVDGNIMVRNVKISVENPGAISDSQVATAEIGTSGSTSSGTFEYREKKKVYAEVSGDVKSITVSEGDSVSKGNTLVVLESTSVTNSVASASDNVRDSQLSLQNQYDKLDDYSITSPIDGTVIVKNYKSGDTIDSNEKLCTIYDLSYLKITMSVDELDINKVSVGQKVQITADAVEGKSFEGEITSVNLAGTTTNGVTTYPVEVQIADFGDLLPGMNVDTYIVIDEVKDVIGIPASAVVRGNRVLVQTGGKSDDSTVPEGYEYVDVEVGLSSDDFVEIKSCIEENASVAYIMTGSSDTMSFGMMGGGMMSGGGGGAPSGGGGNSAGGGPR